MNGRSSVVLRLCVTIFGAAALLLFSTTPARAQAPANAPILQQDGTMTNGVPTTWMSHHLVFSNPGTQAEAAAQGKAELWESVVNSTAYKLQIKRQWMAQQSAMGNAVDPTQATPAEARGNKFVGISKPAPAPGQPTAPTTSGPNPPSKDWSISIGAGGMAANQYPAHYSAGVPLTGGAGTGSCVSDYVAFGLNVQSTTQIANLVAVDNLYAGTSPTGFCGTTPSIKFAYNTSSLSSGKIPGSLVQSLDGTQIAWIESASGAGCPAGGPFAGGTACSLLHVLRWKDATGTAVVTAPTKPTAELASAYKGCTAPCMTTVPYSESSSSLGSPFYDFQSDTAYVGDDSGTLYAITGVFFGTPTLVESAPFTPGNLQLSGTAGKITSPILDFSSGNLFVGGQDGMLYAANIKTGAVSSTPIGSGTAGGGQFATAPVIDGFDQTVIGYAAANAAGVGGSSLAANTQAVVLQSEITPTLFGKQQLAIIGQGSLASTGAANVVTGAFDNNYENFSGTGANTGHYYVVGTAAGSTDPVMYQMSYSGVASIAISGGSGSATNPTITLSGGGGTGASAAVSGGVASVAVTAAGSGYTSFPGITLAGGSGTGAAAAVSDVTVKTVAVTAAGSGYTTPATVSFTGGVGTGGAATATASMGVNTASVTGAGLGYTAIPTVTISGGGGTGAGATASVTVQAVGVSAGGSGYTSIPTVAFTGTHTVAATGTPSLGLNALTASGGTGYTSVPTVTFTGGTTTTGGPGAATATANLGLVTGNPVAGAVISNAGSYTSIPTATFPGGTGVGQSVVGIATVNLTAGGSGFTAPPTVSFTGGTVDTAGAGTTALGVVSVTPTAGSGYTSVPTVGFTGGGGGTGATAAATLLVGTVTVSTAGAGYSGVPTVTFTGGTPTTTATGTAALGVQSVTVNAGGTGFTVIPTVTFSGAGGATATAAVGVSTIALKSTSGAGTVTVTNGNGFSNGTVVTIGTAVYSAGCGDHGTTAGGCSTTQDCATTGACFWWGTTAANTAQALYAALTDNAAYCPTGVTGTWTNTCFTNITAAVTGFTVAYSGAVVTLTNTTASAIAFNNTGATNANNETLSPTTGSIPASGNGSAGCTSGTAEPLTFTGGGTGATGTAAVTGGVATSVTLTAAGSGYTTFPTFTLPGCTTQPSETVTALVTGVSVTGAGTGYTAVPTVTIAGTGGSGATGTAVLGVVSVTVTSGGSGYASVPTVGFTGTATTAATAAASMGISTITVSAPGTGYTSVPTVTLTGGGGGTGGGGTAALEVVTVTIGTPGAYTALPTAVAFSTSHGATATVNTVTVVGLDVTTAGTGYATGPVPVTFGSGTAAATVPLTVVSGTITAAGSYTALPTIGLSGGGGSGATASGSYKVVSVAVAAGSGGTYTTFPTVATSGGGATTQSTLTDTCGVNGLTLSAAGTGYTSLPTIGFSTSGSTSAATATVTDLKVITVAVSAGGDYTSMPAPSFSGNATGTDTVAILAVGVTAAGSGYQSDPTVTFATNAGGTGATGTTKITVTGGAVVWGGGGYTSAPSVTVSCGGCGATGTATINNGATMTAGIAPVLTNSTVSSTANVQATPVSEIYATTPSTADIIFYGYSGTTGTPTVASQTETTGVLSVQSTDALTGVAATPGGTSAIVVDQIDPSNQAQSNSIYFSTLGSTPLVETPTGGSIPGCLLCGTVTVSLTVPTPSSFSIGDSVTIAGVTCTGGACTATVNGTFTVTGVTATQIQYAATDEFSAAQTIAAGGTASDTSKSFYEAVKLLQTGV